MERNVRSIDGLGEIKGLNFGVCSSRVTKYLSLIQIGSWVRLVKND